MQNVTLDDAEQSATVIAGETIAVILTENPTTGFQWTLERLTGPMTLASSTFDAAPTAKPGAGGRRTFVLRADGRGVAELRVKYARPWQAEDAGGQHRTLHVTIA